MYVVLSKLGQDNLFGCFFTILKSKTSANVLVIIKTLEAMEIYCDILISSLGVKANNNTELIHIARQCPNRVLSNIRLGWVSSATFLKKSTKKFDLSLQIRVG